jgi:hypothetical protein
LLNSVSNASSTIALFRSGDELLIASPVIGRD